MKRVIDMVAPSGTVQETIHFTVASLVVVNPTSYTVGIRVGQLDTPDDVDGSDLFVPPISIFVYPVLGNQFAMAFMLPQLNVQPPAMPNRATLMFLDYSESVPSFASLALTTTDVNFPDSLAVTQAGTWNVNADIQNAMLDIAGDVNATITDATIMLPVLTGEQNDIVLDTPSGAATGALPRWVVDRIVTIPSIVRSLTLGRLHPYLDQIQVVGGTSGIVYFDINPRIYVGQHTFTTMFYPGVDTTVIVKRHITSNFAAGDTHYTLLGHARSNTLTQTEQGFMVAKVSPNPQYATTLAYLSGAMTPAGVKASYTLPTDRFVYLTGYTAETYVGGASTIEIQQRLLDDTLIARLYRQSVSTGTFRDANLSANLLLTRALPTKIDIYTSSSISGLCDVVAFFEERTL
jgi:hypothetical protein